ncbi:replicative DNA helicase [Paenibacillus lupini]|uniref:replicative DNA helicase n=1 Tax=Paenibacillus lupini TaxID=1450204 RepID=UPI0014227BF5|nr:replicative DNA helicase [Paenibacillus lupini]NIK24237.1 replicative DNA helicase [Paenibacillus lupini]
MSYEAEAAVLGTLILYGEKMDECILKPEEFDADPRHSTIMEYLRFTWEQDGAINPVLMVQRSGKKIERMGGLEYLMQLSGSVSHHHHFAQYQKVVRNAHIAKRTREAMQGIAVAGSSAGVDTTKLLSDARAAIEEISELTITDSDKGLKHIKTFLEGHSDKIVERKKKRGLTGSKTVSAQLDKMTGGHQKGDLDIYAARPSMGKTALIINEMITAARNGTAVAFISLEMSAALVVDRFICSLANIENTKMRSGDFDDDDWVNYSFAVEEFIKLPIYIDDTTGMSLQDIRREIKELLKKHSHVALYVDYLQLVQPGRSFKEPRDGVAYVSKGLKALGRSLDVSVVAISAVGRQCEQRQDKRPMMSDLRESGSIESDGDNIVFLYRDDYYNSDSEKKGIVELIVAKGRNVGVGKVEMVFLKQYGKFADLDNSGQAPNKGGANGKDSGKDQQRSGVRRDSGSYRKGRADD